MTPDVPRLDLGKALQLAEQRNRAVRMARANSQAEEARLRGARAQRLPSLALNQRLTRLDDDTVSRANAAAVGLSQIIGFEIPPFVYRESYRTEAEVVAPLWTAGALSAGVAGQRELARAAAADVAASLRHTRGAVASAFFSATAAVEEIRARGSARERSQRRLEETERRLEVGLSTRQEVLRWRVEVERAKADEAEARARHLVARLELGNLLDLPPKELGELQPPQPATVERLLRWADSLEPMAVLDRSRPALERLPDVEAADALAEASEAEVRRARAGLWPRLDGAVTYGWLENDTAELDEFADWSASLMLRVPIDAGGQLRSQLRAARAAEEVARIVVDETLASLQLELGRALAEVLRTRTRLRSARRARHEAEARRELLSRQHQVGTAGLLDLIDAHTTEVASDVEAVVAEADFLNAVVLLELVWEDPDLPDGGLIP